jgi:hyperosmotically inducible protein
MRILSVVLAMIVAVAVAGCTHISGKTAGQSVDDTVITAEINAKILKDPDLKTWAIDVDSYRGNVTLSGMVPDWAAAQRVVLYARSTRGVKSVKTNFHIGSQASGAGT